MAQHRFAQLARFLEAAVHNASRATLAMSVAVVALIGADAAVAVDRTTGTSTGAPITSTGAPITSAGAPSPSVGAPSPSVGAPSPQRHATDDPQAVLAKALADALAQGSVHTVTRSVSKAFGTVSFSDDDADNGGVQHIQLYGGAVTVRVIGTTTYLTGNPKGLVGLSAYLDFVPGGGALHHQWLKLTPGDPGYDAISAGITLASTLRADRIGGHLRSLPERTIDGVRVVGITGRWLPGGKHAKATWWVSTDDRPLPVRVVASNDTTTLTQQFSDWGKPITLTTPTKIYGQREATT